MIDQATLQKIKERNAAKQLDQVHSSIHEHWPTVPMFKLQEAGSDVDKLADAVADYISEDRSTIVEEVEQLAAMHMDDSEQAHQNGKAAAGFGMDAVTNAAVRTGDAAGRAVKQAPGTSMSVVFVAGMVAGTLFSILMSPAAKPETTWDRLRSW